MTTDRASFAPPGPAQRALFNALRGNQAATDRFFGVLSGIEPVEAFFAPGNLRRVMGFRRIASVAAEIALQRLRSRRLAAGSRRGRPAGDEPAAASDTR